MSFLLCIQYCVLRYNYAAHLKKKKLPLKNRASEIGEYGALQQRQDHRKEIVVTVKNLFSLMWIYSTEKLWIQIENYEVHLTR